MAQFQFPHFLQGKNKEKVVGITKEQSLVLENWMRNKSLVHGIVPDKTVDSSL